MRAEARATEAAEGDAPAPEAESGDAIRRVAFFVDGEAGGTQKRTAQLASGLAALGFAVDLVVVSARRRNRAAVSPAVEVIRIGSPWTRLPLIRARRRARVYAAVPDLVRYLRERRPDVLVSAANHTHFAALAAHRLARVDSTALVLRLSNSLVAGRDRRWRAHRRLARARRRFRRAHALIAVAPGLRDELLREMPELAERTSLVVNPVIDDSLERLAAAGLERAWEPGSAALIVAVGRLARQKDYATLLRAFSALRTERDARLLILGEGAKRASLESQARKLGIANRILMPGFAENPYPALKRADVVVSSSRWEGLPGVLVEALALGRPVVATDLPGSRDVLGDPSPHPIVPVGDAPAMAAAISRQLSSPPPAEPGRLRARSYTVQAGTLALLSVLRKAHAVASQETLRGARRSRG